MSVKNTLIVFFDFLDTTLKIIHIIIYIINQTIFFSTIKRRLILIKKKKKTPKIE